MSATQQQPDPSSICFGLSEDLDRRSLATFLQLAGRREFAELIAARLDSQEIGQLADHVMLLIRKHLNETEYHRVFLCETERGGHHGK